MVVIFMQNMNKIFLFYHIRRLLIYDYRSTKNNLPYSRFFFFWLFVLFCFVFCVCFHLSSCRSNTLDFSEYCLYFLNTDFSNTKQEKKGFSFVLLEFSKLISFCLFFRYLVSYVVLLCLISNLELLCGLSSSYSLIFELTIFSDV